MTVMRALDARAAFLKCGASVSDEFQPSSMVAAAPRIEVAIVNQSAPYL